MVDPFLPDPEKLAAVRGALPAIGAGIYLNTASAGPLPAETAKAMADVAASELALGRGHPDQALDTLQRIAEARAGAAAILSTDVEAVGLSFGSTEPVALLGNLVDWHPGDRIVASSDIGAATLALVDALARSRRLEVARVDFDADEAAAASAWEAAIRQGCRLVLVPHVGPSTGAVLPLAAVAELAHARGALMVVDGSMAVGALPVAVESLGADLYRFSAQRWLLGPAGIGAVWWGPAIIDRARAAYPGWFGERDAAGAAGLGESLDWNVGSIVGMARSCGWLSMSVGLDWAYRGLALAAQAIDRLASIPGVDVLTPRDRMAALVTFRIAGWDAAAALDELGARVFALAGVVPNLNGIRIGVGFFNTEEEIGRFAEAVELIARHTPETLPPRRSLTIVHAGG